MEAFKKELKQLLEKYPDVLGVEFTVKRTYEITIASEGAKTNQTIEIPIPKVTPSQNAVLGSTEQAKSSPQNVALSPDTDPAVSAVALMGAMRGLDPLIEQELISETNVVLR